MFFVTWHPDSPPVTRWSDKFYPSAQYGLSSDDDLFKLSKLTNTRNHQVAGDTWPYAQWLRIVARPRAVPRPPGVSRGTARLSSTMSTDDNVHEHNTLRPGLGGDLPWPRAAADDPPTLRQHDHRPTPAL